MQTSIPDGSHNLTFSIQSLLRIWPNDAKKTFKTRFMDKVSTGDWERATKQKRSGINGKTAEYGSRFDFQNFDMPAFPTT